MKIKRCRYGFTLMEVMVVIVILGVIAGFAIPNYGKSIRKSHEQDARNQLIAMRSAALIYRANTGAFPTGTNENLAWINSTFDINVLSNDMDYRYSSGGVTFFVTARWDEQGVANDFTLRVNQTGISASNPCCNNGACPSLGSC